MFGLLVLVGAALPAPAQTADPKAACRAMVSCAVGTALSRLPLATPCNGSSLCEFIQSGGNKPVVDSWFASGGACNAIASAAQGFNPQQLLAEALGCLATAGGGTDVQNVLCSLSPEAFFTEAVNWLGCELPGEIENIVGEVGQVISTIGGEGSVVYKRGDKEVILKSLVTKVFSTDDGCGWITDCGICSKTIQVSAGAPAADGRHCLWAWDGRVHNTGTGFVALARCAEGEPFRQTGRLDGRVVVAVETLLFADESDFLPPTSLASTCERFQGMALASIGLHRGDACSDTLTAPTVDIADLSLPDSLRSMIPAGMTKIELGVPFKPCREGMVCANATLRTVNLVPVKIPGVDLKIERDLEVGTCSEILEEEETCGESFTACREGLVCQTKRCAPALTDYELAFATGAAFGAGTDADIDVQLIGEEGMTGVVRVNPLISGNAFERGNTDVARLVGVRNVGRLKRIVINHHAVLGSSRLLRDPWTLTSVTVRPKGQAAAAVSCDCTLNEGLRALDLAADYDLVFVTAGAAGSGTDADITVTLEGIGGLRTEPIRVNQLIRGNAFERGSTDRARLAGVRNVGNVTRILIDHHNLLGNALPDAWTLASVSVQKEGRASTAGCNCTLNGDRKALDLKAATPR